MPSANVQFLPCTGGCLAVMVILIVSFAAGKLKAEKKENLERRKQRSFS
jgi:hypothetical protein